ncbi:MAG: histidine--tRNA ligase [Planctomycetota bacterium]
MKLQRPQGTEDILPEQIGLWHFIEDTVHNLFPRYGYSEIRTPVMELGSLFNRAAGETSDVVEKQMYFIRAKEDDEKEPLALRPEMTASVVRAYLEHSLDKTQAFRKLYYLGPVFRHERPQKGRLRQHCHLGIEALGSYEPLLDVEVIDLALVFLKAAGIKDCTLNLNSIGCPDCRKAYIEALRSHLAKDASRLCGNCQRRFGKNILRILDCKEQKCYEITSRIDPMENFLCQECRAHFEQVKNGLADNGIPYVLNKHLVRGLDYYTRTVFEITSSGLGAQNTLCGGGRYDNMVEQFGGPKTGAAGFGMGIERVIAVLDKQIKPAGPDVYVVITDGGLRKEAFRIIRNLRHHSISADMDYESRSLKAQFRNADRLKARFVAVLGPDELARESVKLKEMATGAEREIKLTSLAEEIKKL